MLQQLSVNNPNAEIKRTNELEMKCFIGILIRMSTVKNTSIRDYWLSDLKLSYITDVFPRDRFLYLLKYFDISNNSQNDNIGRTGKITPIIDGFKQFSKAVNPAYNISIDESIVPFKGRSDMKIITIKWLYFHGIL